MNQSSLCWARWAANRPAARPGRPVRLARKGRKVRRVHLVRKGRQARKDRKGRRRADAARITALETEVAELQATIAELKGSET